MSFLPPIFTVLRDSPRVSGIVAGRIYRSGAAPQRVVNPYLTWTLIAAIPQNQLSGTPGVDASTIQVDCWSIDDAQCESLAEAVRDAVEPYAHMTGIPINTREQGGTKLYRIGLQFDWWHFRSLAP